MNKVKRYELKSETPEDSFIISKLKTRIRNRMKNMHKHSYYEIVYFIPSKHLTYIENIVYTLDMNSISVTPPNVRHKNSGNIQKCERTLINFSYEFVQPIAAFLDIDINRLFSSYVLIFSDEQMESLTSISEKMLIEYRKNILPSKNVKLKLLLASFLFIMTQAIGKGIPEGTNEIKIGNVIDYLNRNYSDDTDLDFLAAKFFISKYDLCRKIKSITGYTYSTFLTIIRLNHAREFLENSHLAISEISTLVGYNSSAYFSSSFKKHIGVSPNEYRKNKLVQ